MSDIGQLTVHDIKACMGGPHLGRYVFKDDLFGLERDFVTPQEPGYPAPLFDVKMNVIIFEPLINQTGFTCVPGAMTLRLKELNRVVVLVGTTVFDATMIDVGDIHYFQSGAVGEVINFNVHTQCITYDMLRFNTQIEIGDTITSAHAAWADTETALTIQICGAIHGPWEFDYPGRIWIHFHTVAFDATMIAAGDTLTGVTSGLEGTVIDFDITTQMVLLQVTTMGITGGISVFGIVDNEDFDSTNAVWHALIGVQPEADVAICTTAKPYTTYVQANFEDPAGIVAVGYEGGYWDNTNTTPWAQYKDNHYQPGTDVAHSIMGGGDGEFTWIARRGLVMGLVAHGATVPGFNGGGGTQGASGDLFTDDPLTWSAIAGTAMTYAGYHDYAVQEVTDLDPLTMSYVLVNPDNIGAKLNDFAKYDGSTTDPVLRKLHIFFDEPIVVCTPRDSSGLGEDQGIPRGWQGDEAPGGISGRQL